MSNNNSQSTSVVLRKGNGHAPASSPAPSNPLATATAAKAPVAPVDNGYAEALRERDALRAEIARLKAAQAQPRRLTLKVTPKGGLSVYGLGRFPTTLYREQWEAVLSIAEDIKAAVAKLPTKAERPAEEKDETK